MIEIIATAIVALVIGGFGLAAAITGNHTTLENHNTRDIHK